MQGSEVSGFLVIKFITSFQYPGLAHPFWAFSHDLSTVSMSTYIRWHVCWICMFLAQKQSPLNASLIGHLLIAVTLPMGHFTLTPIFHSFQKHWVEFYNELSSVLSYKVLENRNLDFLKKQLTLKQYGFELYGSTYMWIFSIIIIMCCSTISLHYSQLVESVDVNYIQGVPTVEVQHPQPACRSKTHCIYI